MVNRNHRRGKEGKVKLFLILLRGAWRGRVTRILNPDFHMLHIKLSCLSVSYSRLIHQVLMSRTNKFKQESLW